MSKLLNRAKASYDGAKFYLKQAGNDDAYLDMASFATQQSLEFLLKAIIELNGDSYVRNHDIRAQLNKLEAINVELPCMKKIV